MHKTPTLFLIGSMALSSCTPMEPGGLSAEEFKALSPAERNEVRVRQNLLEAEREPGFDRYEPGEDFY